MARTTASAATQYACDVTYGTNNELGFDYLRDNMKYQLEEMVQRGHNLRDRRRGRLDPDRRGAHAADHLGPVDDRSDLYNTIDASSRVSSTTDYEVDEKQRPVHLTEAGNENSGAMADARPNCSRAIRSTTSRTSPWFIT